VQTPLAACDCIFVPISTAAKAASLAVYIFFFFISSNSDEVL